MVLQLHCLRIVHSLMAFMFVSSCVSSCVCLSVSSHVCSSVSCVPSLVESGNHMNTLYKVLIWGLCVAILAGSHCN